MLQFACVVYSFTHAAVTATLPCSNVCIFAKFCGIFVPCFMSVETAVDEMHIFSPCYMVLHFPVLHIQGPHLTVHCKKNDRVDRNQCNGGMW